MEARLGKWGKDLKYGRMYFLSVKFDEHNYLGPGHPKDAMLAAFEPQQLHQTLLGFSLYERRVNDIVELARYAYSQGDDTRDELRQLVVEYMVLNVSAFSKHPSFILLLQEGGEFVMDFWNQVYNVYLVP